jgi:hypothetical protein
MDEEQQPKPAITASDLLAAELLEAIEAIAGRIPQLETPHPMTAGSVRGGRTVPDDAIISMIGAVENAPQLQALGTFNVDSAREMLQFNLAFRHVVDRLNMLAGSITFTMEARKAAVVFDLMRTYAIMKSLARDPSAGLVNQIETLRREIGRKKPRRTASPPEG